MELPDEFTSFWSAQIQPETKCKITIPERIDCVLSNAALSQDSSRPESGKVILFAKVNQFPEVAVISFTINSFESSMLDIQFSEGDVIEFSIQGECPVHIAGYITGGYALDIENPVGGPVFTPVQPKEDNELQPSEENETKPQEETEIKPEEAN